MLQFFPLACVEIRSACEQLVVGDDDVDVERDDEIIPSPEVCVGLSEDEDDELSLLMLILRLLPLLLEDILISMDNFRQLEYTCHIARAT